MPPFRAYKRCVVCGLRAGRIDQKERKFMTKFPLDPNRCREWVKIIGNEDLAYVPIEKLHQLKYVCGDHFKPKDFNRRRSRLKRSAIPSVNIQAQALSDDLLLESPYHISSIKDPEQHELECTPHEVMDVINHPQVTKSRQNTDRDGKQS